MYRRRPSAGRRVRAGHPALVKQRNPQARAQALASLSELTQLGTGMRDAMMRLALRAYTDSL